MYDNHALFITVLQILVKFMPMKRDFENKVIY